MILPHRERWQCCPGRGAAYARAPARQIAQAVRFVAEGDSILFPDAVRRLATARPVRPEAAARTAALTQRETEILRLMARGLSNQAISAELVVSQETVKTHVGNILAKLGADNRTQAVITAFQAGLADPEAA
ncbi:response regulator transcription factor [Streptomyces sp. NPDC056682]|uniref:helix-turn-helix transcriptional regulator n=1 Tax=Streptomyces sp. NPDC056682 TaxID=3345909 RepID=UPI0036A6C673